MIYSDLVCKCHWCRCASACSPCELITGEKVPLCAECENDLIQQIEDSWLPDTDDSGECV